MTLLHAVITPANNIARGRFGDGAAATGVITYSRIWIYLNLWLHLHVQPNIYQAVI